MRLSTEDGYLRAEGLPSDGWCELRFYINGVRAHSVPFDAMDAGGIQVALAELGSRVASTDALIQCYAVQPDNTVCASARLDDVSFPPPSLNRNRSAAVDCNRLVASAMHAAGDVHRWDFPLSLLAPEGAAGDGLTVYTLCVRFDLESHIAGAEPVATVRWHLPAADAPPSKRPRLAARACFGEVHSVTQVHEGCMQSVFTVAVLPGEGAEERRVRCEIGASPTAYLVLGALRYAAYGVCSPSGCVPSVIRDAIPSVKIEEDAPPMGRRCAILVGVSKYTRRQQRRTSDLEYADDDVVLWYHYLTERGYDCKIFGDEFSPYPVYNGVGTVRNVRAAVRQMVAEASAPEDHVVFITSSHGNGDGRGSSYLCLLPDPRLPDATDLERAGSYMDVDLAADLSADGRTKSNVFVFLDACFSEPGLILGHAPTRKKKGALTERHHRGIARFPALRHGNYDVYPKGVRVRQCARYSLTR